MTDGHRPQSDSRRTKKLIVLASSVSLAVAGVFLVRQEQAPIPNPDLEDSYQEVAEAIKDAQQLVQQSPSNAAVWGNYGMVLAAHEYISESIRCFKEAARLAPENYKWHYYLGDLHEHTNREFALRCFVKASDRIGTRDLVLKTLVDTRQAELLFASGNLEDAWKLIERCIMSSPKDDRVCYTAARIKVAENLPKEALKYLKAATGRYQQRAMIELRAQAYGMLGKDGLEQLTLQSREQVQNQGWNDPLLLEVQRCRVDPHWVAFQAKNSIEQGQVEQGLETLAGLIARHPAEITFRVEFARQLLQRRRFDEVHQTLDHESTENDFNAQSIRGTAYLLAEQWDQAIESFQTASKLKPTSGGVKRDLAFALGQSGQLEAACVALREAIQLSPNESEYQMALIKLLLTLGRSDEVKVASDAFKKRFPELVETIEFD